MPENDQFENYIKQLEKLTNKEQLIINSPQFKLVDSYAQRLVSGQERQMDILIELGTTSKVDYTIEDYKGFIDVYCFESAYGSEDQMLSKERLSIVTMLVMVDNAFKDPTFKYIEQLAFGSYSYEATGALNLLFSLASANVRKEETIKLIDWHADKCNKNLLPKLLKFLLTTLADQPTGNKTIAKIHNRMQFSSVHDDHGSSGGIWLKIKSWFKSFV